MVSDHARKVRVLAIDGGGIRGIVPATVLAHIEEMLGVPAAHMFDLYAGTSTGGLLAMALVRPNGPMSARAVADLYERQAQTIFPSSVLGGVRNLLSPKYPAAGIEGVLRDTFGTRTLATAVRPIVIPSFDLIAQAPVIFRSWHGDAEKQLMADVGRATSAGETFFPAEKKCLIDGGNVANNPTVLAVLEARDAIGCDFADIHVLSLGTGRYDPSQANVADGGLLAWATNVSQVTIDGQSALAEMQAMKLCGARYLRINTGLTKDASAMDNVKPSNLAYLRDVGRQLFEANRRFIADFFTP